MNFTLTNIFTFMKTKYIFTLLLLGVLTVFAKKKPQQTDSYNYGLSNNGSTISIQFEKGKEHNHPIFAIWIADENGKYIQTLYVSESIGKGVYDRVDRKTGKWQSGVIQRPATVPFWAHQRNVKNNLNTYMPTHDQPIPDAYTGATPPNSFIMNCKTEYFLKGKYKVYVELNQTWDWNEYWTNNLYPNNADYKTSCQPALVYEAEINTDFPNQEVTMKPIGHSHYAGEDGSLNTDLSTMTTALKIAKKIVVKLL